SRCHIIWHANLMTFHSDEGPFCDLTSHILLPHSSGSVPLIASNGPWNSNVGPLRTFPHLPEKPGRPAGRRGRATRTAGGARAGCRRARPGRPGNRVPPLPLVPAGEPGAAGAGALSGAERRGP